VIWDVDANFCSAFGKFSHENGHRVAEANTTVNRWAKQLPVLRLSVLENSLIKHDVGSPIQVEDEDESQAINLYIDPGSDDFAINPCSGQITVRTSSLNFEAKDIYTIHIKAVDNGFDPPSLFALATVEIALGDVNEVPWCDNAAVEIFENTDSTVTLAGLQGFDVDEDQANYLHFTIANDGGGSQFAIDPGGLLTINPPDARFIETDFEAQSVYTLTVRATDNGIISTVEEPVLFGDCTVDVTVVDTNEQPVLSAGLEFFVEENSPVGTFVDNALQAFDPDAAGAVATTRPCYFCRLHFLVVIATAQVLLFLLLFFSLNFQFIVLVI
jgi:hypothetical protein